MNELHDAAREYHRRHKLPITLCQAKKPIGKGWPAKRWTLREIDREYRACPTLNVGTRLGPDAGLIDFDADSPEAERAMLELFDGGIPLTPTFLSPGGRHWLMAWTPDVAGIRKAVVHFGPLEVRLGANGKAAQSLLPPSITDGRQREWIDGLNLAECDAAIPSKTILRRIIEYAGEEHRGHKTCHVSSVSSVFQLVQTAIAATLPTEPGHRHRLIFNFVRQLKAVPSLAEADPNVLRQHVQEWHRQALPFIRTKAFEETWLDFLESWENVKFAAGEEPVAVIFAQALSRSLPACAEQYEQMEVRSLVALCRELQRNAGERPFFLDCRTAGRLLAVQHTIAWRWLRLLVHDKVLQRVKPGIRHRATEYRYIGDP